MPVNPEEMAARNKQLEQQTVVNYVLTEYPCMLRCLEDGSLDLSNNISQISAITNWIQ